MSTSAPILITAAMTAEIGPLVRRLKLWRTSDLSGVITYQGDGSALLVTGVGPRRAAQNTEAMIRRIKPRGLIITGFAGALDPQLKIGDAVEASGIIDGAAGRTIISPVTPGGRVLYTSEMLIGDVASKRELRRKTRAAMVDMESAAIAGVSAAAEIPWRCVRVISDDANTALPEGLAGLTHPDGRANPTRAGWYALTHPHHILTLLRLGIVSHKCSKTLAEQAIAMFNTF